ncbi:MAG: DNA translocase FtsK [Clostridiales bacterium]|nr:DNA translocase FtsK [Clostridiales bacterium]
MASTQKRTSSSGGGSRSRSSSSTSSNSGGKRTSSGSSRSSSASKGRSSRKSAPAKKPYRREVGGAVCLLLALFGAIGYFKTDEGAVIALFCDLLKGLCGYGFYLAPPLLLAAAGILIFHRGRPVRLRVAGALALPVLAGAVMHLLLCATPYEWGMTLFGQLWTDGKAIASGGVVGGFIAMAFRFAFTTVGAVVILLLLTAAAVLCALRLAPADILDYFREQRERRPEYDPEDYPEPEERPKRAARREPEPVPSHRKNAAIDIPVDDGPLLAKKPTTPVTTVRKKSFFDKVAGASLPGQKGDRPLVEEEPPEYEDVPELRPMKEPPRTPKPGPVVPPPAAVNDVIPFPAPTPIREEPVPPPIVREEPVPPPVIREPEAPKPSPRPESGSEEKSAAEEMARELEAGLEQDAPVYRYPPITLLNENRGGSAGASENVLQANQQRLQDALQSFGVSARIVNVIQGPSIVRYELELDQGVKLSKLTNLSNDIALALGASGVRVAPIPNKISTVGIEVPKPKGQVSPVVIRDVLGSQTFAESSSKVSFAVGMDISGRPVVGNIAKLPHMLIAGTTGSGKSVCTNSLVISLLYKASPEEVRLIIIDPKVVEFTAYNGIPHLLIPVVTDPKKAAGALQWSVSEMEKRYHMFSEVGARDLATYNSIAKKREDLEPMPQIVIVIDELADLMMTVSKEVEDSIIRVAQKGRASGMHLVIATQSPRADVITGLMKANIPSRIALKVASGMESRIILDTMGAEKLGGPGDMLFAAVGQEQQRVQGCFISDEEVANVLEFIKESASARYDESVMHEIEKNAEDKEKAAKGVGGSDPGGGGGNDYDELLPAAIDVVLEVGQASVSMLQRRLKLGYGRAARLVDQMEEKGVVGPFEGSKPRQLLITKEQWAEMQYRQDMVAAVPDELPFEGDAFPQDAPPFDMDE